MENHTEDRELHPKRVEKKERRPPKIAYIKDFVDTAATTVYQKVATHKNACDEVTI